MLELPPAERVSRDYPKCLSSVPCPLPRRTRTGARVDCFPIPCSLPSTVERSASATSLFEACSGFTHVTARWIARQPKAAFVTRLRRSQLPSHTARQLPDQSTTPWTEPSSVDTSRLRGALPSCETSDLSHVSTARRYPRVGLVGRPRARKSSYRRATTAARVKSLARRYDPRS